MSTQTKDTETFQNPQGPWEHIGPFSIELTERANKNIVPTSARIDGNTVHVRIGRIAQQNGAIQFYSENDPFSWNYSSVKAVRYENGDLIWVNYNYRHR